MAAAHFAADKHRSQKRKDSAGTPYINHPLAVAEVLSRVAGVTDCATIQAALLHDTLEDTDTSGEELESRFGKEVRNLVEDVTDDKSVSKSERKRRQVEHSPDFPPKARLIKLADKICNVGDLTSIAPSGWPVERKKEYVDWAETVINGIRGSNPALETLFDQIVAEKRRLFV